MERAILENIRMVDRIISRLENRRVRMLSLCENSQTTELTLVDVSSELREIDDRIAQQLILKDILLRLEDVIHRDDKGQIPPLEQSKLDNDTFSAFKRLFKDGSSLKADILHSGPNAVMHYLDLMETYFRVAGKCELSHLGRTALVTWKATESETAAILSMLRIDDQLNEEERRYDNDHLVLQYSIVVQKRVRMSEKN